MQKRAANFFQLVPFKEPCQNDSETLSSDNEIDSFDTSKFIFTDISYDTNDQVFLTASRILAAQYFVVHCNKSHLIFSVLVSVNHIMSK